MVRYEIYEQFQIGSQLQLLKFQNRTLNMLDQKYTIIQRKQSNLFKAIDNLTKKTVILKKISFSAVSSKQKEHIVQEVNTLVRMDYIHILKYLDFEINKKDITVDIAMEHCQGGTLADLIQKCRNEGKRIEEEEVWRVFYQLVQAIGYIHRDGVIHRNINPSNIYFKEDKRKNIKLGGFSLAKKVQLQQPFASTVITSTHYLSPEQAQSGICSSQTDIWALGCLIYEMCMLQSPFKHSNEFQKARMIKNSRPKKVSGYSTELNRLIFWCLQKCPEDRPALSDLQGAPEISMRIRERRYLQKQNWVLNKDEQLLRRQHQLFEKEKDLLQKKMVTKYSGLKKKNSEVLSNRNMSYLKHSC